MSVSSHNNLGGPKKRGRKPKKVIEKELLQEYNSETQNLKDQKNIYENMQYLSQREKDLFEQKFNSMKTFIWIVGIIANRVKLIANLRKRLSVSPEFPFEHCFIQKVRFTDPRPKQNHINIRMRICNSQTQPMNYKCT